MLNEELKPCPFCGSKVEIAVFDINDDEQDEEYENDPIWIESGEVIYRLKYPNVDNCPILSYRENDYGQVFAFVDVSNADSREKLIKMWNTRINTGLEESDVKDDEKDYFPKPWKKRFGIAVALEHEDDENPEIEYQSDNLYKAYQYAYEKLSMYTGDTKVMILDQENGIRFKIDYFHI